MCASRDVKRKERLWAKKSDVVYGEIEEVVWVFNTRDDLHHTGVKVVSLVASEKGKKREAALGVNDRPPSHDFPSAFSTSYSTHHAPPLRASRVHREKQCVEFKTECCGITHPIRNIHLTSLTHNRSSFSIRNSLLDNGAGSRDLNQSRLSGVQTTLRSSREVKDSRRGCHVPVIVGWGSSTRNPGEK